MNRKIPPGAFEHYWGLGPNRSYDTLAREYGVSRRAITKLAAKERWKEQIRELEAKSRERAKEKIGHSLDEMNDRHLKLGRFLQSKGVETLRLGRIDTPAEAVRAINIGVTMERLVCGEPTDRVENLEAIVRREYQMLFKPAGQEDWPEAELEPVPQFETSGGGALEPVTDDMQEEDEEACDGEAAEAG